MKTKNTSRVASILALSALLTLSSSALAAGADARVTDTKDGFTFLLAPKWIEVPLNGSNIKALLTQATKNDPSLKKSIDNQVKNAAKEGIKIFAIGPIANKFAANLNVGVESSAGAPTGAAFFSAVKSQEKSQLAAADIGDVHVRDVALPFANAVEVSYELPKSVAGVPASGLQVVFEHTTHVYFLTITSLTGTSNAQTLKDVASNWKWL
jgi:hypothetical protein